MDSHLHIARLLLDAITAFTLHDGKARTFGTDHLLSVSEIHMIDYLGHHRGSSVTQMAQDLMVTKGAVSQMAKKLDVRGYLSRKEDTQNKARKVLSLTEKGLTAYREHMSYHQNLEQHIDTILQVASVEQKQMIGIFLHEMTTYWKQ